MLLAAFAHDSGHEALTNSYYINSKHIWAENTASPLENMHVSNLNKLMKKHELGITAYESKMVTEMIIKTDNLYHQELINSLIEFSKKEEVLHDPEGQLLLSCALLHAADLNNSTK